MLYIISKCALHRRIDFMTVFTDGHICFLFFGKNFKRIYPEGFNKLIILFLTCIILILFLFCNYFNFILYYDLFLSLKY